MRYVSDLSWQLAQLRGNARRHCGWKLSDLSGEDLFGSAGALQAPVQQ
jgi:hypothetical protein